MQLRTHLKEVRYDRAMPLRWNRIRSRRDSWNGLQLSLFPLPHGAWRSLRDLSLRGALNLEVQERQGAIEGVRFVVARYTRVLWSLRLKTDELRQRQRRLPERRNCLRPGLCGKACIARVCRVKGAMARAVFWDSVILGAASHRPELVCGAICRAAKRWHKVGLPIGGHPPQTTVGSTAAGQRIKPPLANCCRKESHTGAPSGVIIAGHENADATKHAAAVIPRHAA